MQVVHYCPSNHVWTQHGPCPICGSDAVTRGDPGGTIPILPEIKPANFPTIPGYELQKAIGSGGMGVVYQAKQTSLGRIVALKVIRSGELANPQDQRRFVLEAEVIARLQHPNIVQVYDVGVAADGPFYTMELLGGRNLAEKLDSGPMPFRNGAKLLAIIARAVDCAHKHGVVHRDLKPANILMTEDGTPKLVDFGVAKNLASDDGLTETGKPIGTPGFMAPEQAAGKKVIGPGADVYALGVILYKFLTGRVPFEGDNLYDVLHSIITADPVSPAWYRTDVPRDLEAICLKCLRKSPAERYVKATDLADDLDRYLNHQRISVGWTPPWRQLSKWCRRHPTATTSITTLLLVLISIGVVASFYERSKPVVAVLEQAEDPAVKLRRDEVVNRVKVLMQTEPKPDKESPHPVKEVPKLVAPSYDGIAIISDERVVDLRAWKQEIPNDPATESYVIFNNRRVVSKNKDVASYTTRFQTSGRGLVLRAISPGPEWATVDFSTDVVGGQVMKTGHVTVDIQGEPLGSEFTAQSKATFIGNLQKPEDQWLGLIGFKDSLRSSMLLLFPKDRPFKEYQLRVAPTSNDKPQPFKDLPITFKSEANDWLYWEVSAPKDGYVYRIDWTW